MNYETAHDEFIKAGRKAGLSHAQLTVRFNKRFRVTQNRSAIIKRCERLGLLGQRPQPQTNIRTRALPRISTTPGLVSLEALRPHHCRYIPGDPAGGHCGRPRRDEKTAYCPDHHALTHCPPRTETPTGPKRHDHTATTGTARVYSEAAE